MRLLVGGAPLVGVTSSPAGTCAIARSPTNHLPSVVRDLVTGVLLLDGVLLEFDLMGVTHDRRIKRWWHDLSRL